MSVIIKCFGRPNRLPWGVRVLFHYWHFAAIILIFVTMEFGRYSKWRHKVSRNDDEYEFKIRIRRPGRGEIESLDDPLYTSEPSVMYQSKPPPPTSIIFGMQEAAIGHSDEPNVFETGDAVADFYNVMKTPTGVCRKLFRAGGLFSCREKNQTTPLTDGFKYICLDPEFQIGTNHKNDKKCTILSFGVEFDTSFDAFMLRAGCQVHLFDIVNYKHNVPEDANAHFHKIGLGIRREDVFVPRENKTFEFDNLNNLIIKYDLTKQILNVLKMDIEGSEWEVLEDLLQRPFLAAIGQIAVEVHIFNHEKKSNEVHSKNINKFRKIILAFEERGFRRVVYWDNVQPKFKMKDRKGHLHEGAGELLLVNSRFYDEAYRREGFEAGLNFHVS